MPGRDELPGLPQPRRRGPLRGGVHPLPRPEPGRRDVRLRLLRPLRARLPPRRHRPSPRDPGHEAVPRGVARGLGHPRRHAPRSRRARSASPSSGRGRPASPWRASWPSRATRSRSSTASRSPAARCSSASRPSACRARRSRWTSASSNASASTFRYNTTVGVDVLFEDLQRDFDAIAITRRRHGRGRPGRPGGRPRGRPVRRRLHEEGQPRRAARGGPRRRRHRRRLHGDGLLPDQPPPRRGERDDRLPAHPFRARRRRRGAGRDRARGRPHGVPRQPDRDHGRGRQGSPACVSSATGSASRTRPAAALRSRSRARSSRSPPRHGDSRRLPGRRPHLPAGRVELRDRPGAGPGGPGHVRDQRARRLRLRRLRHRAHDAHRGGRPRQEVLPTRSTATSPGGRT